MPSLGGISFISLKGHVAKPGLMTEDVSREGTDGAAFRKRHVRAVPFGMLAFRDCDNLADAQSKYEAVLAMQGTVVELVDDYGVTHPDVMVIDVRRVDERKVLAAGGGAPA